MVDESRNVSNIRRLEKQLSESQATLEEFKLQAQQATEVLEQRYLHEIKELQNGNDDTADAWLEKHRAAQQEIDRLESLVAHLEQEHHQKLTQERMEHEAKIKEWKTKCDKQDNEIDNQAQQISSLLGQVEDLQSSLEAATLRFEQRAALHRASDDGLAKNKDIHRSCEEKLLVRQHEVEELHRRISELKETHETQLNRFGQEKARELQELRNEMKATQEMLQKSKGSDEAWQARLVAIAEQHRKEIQVIHNQSQKLIDIKEQELGSYAYRVKTIMATKQKEMARAHKQFTEQIADYKVWSPPLLGVQCIWLTDKETIHRTVYKHSSSIWMKCSKNTRHLKRKMRTLHGRSARAPYTMQILMVLFER
ncbi:hypothetical protein BX666DRAFT_1865513 [Dichotomocladium elegans]|nr:hypothetical protein BX666DRAFT_1865513 [Dichotomocladium elegans]